MKLVVVAMLCALVTVGLMLNAYNREDQFRIFVDGLNDLTDEIVNEINNDPTAAGVAKAQIIVIAKKGELKKKLANALKQYEGSQANNQTLIELEQAIQTNRKKIMDLYSDNPDIKQAMKQDRQFRENTEKLLDDYTSIIR